ncbi:MAG: UDP-N-acetylglucosamine 1-carboxyvinyltransferase [Patescibacteria group bacterium]|nr:UDP-N-acetylglucosamine 1-carboxyvinyltransferase [Patescibacteria group bacterium]
MSKFTIEGGTPLKGKVKVGGAKNSGFKLMIAALLSDEPTTLHNISDIRDVAVMREIIENLGGKVLVNGDHALRVEPKRITKFEVPTELANKSRASSMLMGPLLARFGKAILPLPGGDKIGARPLDRHLTGIEQMGASFDQVRNVLTVKASSGLAGSSYSFVKNTHTGTDTLILAAVLAEGMTVLKNAAAEPEVEDLINLLNLMGAKIKRTAPRTIEIQGVNRLHGIDYTVMPDRNEAGTFACMALATKGDIVIENVRSYDLTAFLKKLDEIGAKYEIIDTDSFVNENLRVYYGGSLKAANVVTNPHPGFMTDWQAVWTTLMTQAEGESIIHETIFENRFNYIPFLVEMGAKIELFNPKVDEPEGFYNFNWEDNKPEYFHAAKVIGSSVLSAIKSTVPDIRAGATLTIAALSAEGTSTIDGIEHIERGYEDFEKRLASLGAKIRKVD